MNQPKFKFGDKVTTNTASPHYQSDIFIIGSILWSEKLHRYEYGSTCGKFSIFPESSIELYQEPQEKKAYAYMDSLGEIRLSINKDSGFKDVFTRISGFDIDYSCFQQNCAKDH